MKKIIPSILLAASASSSLLFAQNAKITPNALNLSLLQYSNMNEYQPQLMMNPSMLEEGAETLGEELGVFGRKAASPKIPVVATTVAYSPVGSSSSSVASAMVLDQRVVAATVTVLADATGEENSTAQFFEREICDNIYLRCLAKVATISLAERASVEGIFGLSQEAKEWAAAKQAAENDVKKRQRELEVATEGKKLANKEIDQVLPHRNEYGKDIIAKAYADQKVKECAEALSKKRVITAEVTLFAIQVQGTVQSEGAQADLEKAISEEKEALRELQRARICVETLTNAQSSAGASLPVVEAIAIYSDNCAYDVYPHHHQLSPSNVLVSPEKIAQERQEVLAKKEKAAAAFEAEFTKMIERDKAQAEKAAETATKARERAESIGISEIGWGEAIEEVKIAESAYENLARVYQMYQERAAEHYQGGILNIQRSQYNIELRRTETQRAYWAAKPAECRNKQEDLKRQARTRIEGDKRLQETWSSMRLNMSEKGSIARAAGKIEEGVHWNNAYNTLCTAVGKLERAAEADEASRAEIAEKYREVTDQQRHAVEAFIQAARACSVRKKAEGASWNNAAEGFCSASKQLEKAIEVDESGKTTQSQTLREAAAKYKQAVEKYKQAAQFRVEHPWTMGATALDSEGEALSKEADAMVREANKQN